MSEIFLNKNLIDAYTFVGIDPLNLTINVGDKKPLDSSIELLDFLFVCGNNTSVSTPLTINITNISNSLQILRWYYNDSMNNTTSIYYCPTTPTLITAGSLLHITCTGLTEYLTTDTGIPNDITNSTYSGIIRFTYRGQIDKVDI